jgi:hypothetical protein
MSITITINNNRAACDEAGLAKTVVEACGCDCGSDKELPMCQYCGGTGEFRHVVYPYDLNVANGNFARLWAALGLPIKYQGEVDPRRLRRALRVGHEIVQRGTELHQELGKATTINFGITDEQAQRYWRALEEICDVAERREELVIWY